MTVIVCQKDNDGCWRWYKSSFEFYKCDINTKYQNMKLHEKSKIKKWNPLWNNKKTWKVIPMQYMYSDEKYLLIFVLLNLNLCHLSEKGQEIILNLRRWIKNVDQSKERWTINEGLWEQDRKKSLYTHEENKQWRMEI